MFLPTLPSITQCGVAVCCLSPGGRGLSHLRNSVAEFGRGDGVSRCQQILHHTLCGRTSSQERLGFSMLQCFRCLSDGQDGNDETLRNITSRITQITRLLDCDFR